MREGTQRAGRLSIIRSFIRLRPLGQAVVGVSIWLTAQPKDGEDHACSGSIRKRQSFCDQKPAHSSNRMPKAKRMMRRLRKRQPHGSFAGNAGNDSRSPARASRLTDLTSIPLPIRAALFSKSPVTILSAGLPLSAYNRLNLHGFPDTVGKSVFARAVEPIWAGFLADRRPNCSMRSS